MQPYQYQQHSNQTGEVGEKEGEGHRFIYLLQVFFCLEVTKSLVMKNIKANAKRYINAYADDIIKI